MRYKAVIFDLDGTLTNSVDAFKRGEKAAFAEFGVEVTDADFVTIHTEGVKNGLRRLFDRVDPSQYDQLNERRHHFNHAFLREDTTVYPDAHECLLALAQIDLPRGIVTSARNDYIESSNMRSQFLNLISVLAAHEDVGDRLKPDPYGLEIGSEKLGLRPSDCLYVGDAQFDTEAAFRIGMDSCYIERPAHLPQEKEGAKKFATYHIQHLSRVLKILRNGSSSP